jgi:hypothetical protein
LGTNKGLFAWDRKDMFWARFAVAGSPVDAAIANVELKDDSLTVTVQDAAGASRKFTYDTKTGAWAEPR